MNLSKLVKTCRTCSWGGSHFWLRVYIVVLECPFFLLFFNFGFTFSLFSAFVLVFGWWLMNRVIYFRRRQNQLFIITWKISQNDNYFHPSLTNLTEKKSWFAKPVATYIFVSAKFKWRDSLDNSQKQTQT